MKLTAALILVAVLTILGYGAESAVSRSVERIKAAQAALEAT